MNVTRGLSTLLTALGLIVTYALPARAQLAAPGDSGVVMGHVHLLVRDVNAERQFWQAIGGTPVTNGPIQLIRFPGVFILVRQGEPSAGTVGSIINHIGFNVRDVKSSEAAWAAAGVTVEAGVNPEQRWLMTPSGVRVEILEARIDEPIRMHHIHWNITAVPEMQAWYARMFGAVPGKRGRFDAADLPGVNLTFSAVDERLAATKGRALDHIGFEVRDLRRLLQTMQAAGVTLDTPYREVPNTGLAAASFTDPWGTTVELTEGIEPKP